MSEEPKIRERCCGIIWEHRAVTSAKPCPDRPHRAVGTPAKQRSESPYDRQQRILRWYRT